MRRILLATLFGLGLTASVQAIAGQEASMNAKPVCEPRALIPLSSELGHRLCVQTSIVAHLDVTGPALYAAARAVVEHPIGYQPSRDPDAIVCRELENPADASQSRLLRCGYNSYWSRGGFRGGMNDHSMAAFYGQGGGPAPN